MSASILTLFRAAADRGPRQLELHKDLDDTTEEGEPQQRDANFRAGLGRGNQIATGKPIEQANAMAETLRTQWNGVLERHGIAGYVYGECSTFHVYFETDKVRIKAAKSPEDLHTSEAQRLKGMSHELIDAYQLSLRHHGVDVMSSTGGVLSSVHSERDIAEATDAFEKTIGALRDQRLIQTI